MNFIKDIIPLIKFCKSNTIESVDGKFNTSDILSSIFSNVGNKFVGKAIKSVTACGSNVGFVMASNIVFTGSKTCKIKFNGKETNANNVLIAGGVVSSPTQGNEGLLLLPKAGIGIDNSGNKSGNGVKLEAGK